jgi:hypothetical protein
MRKLIDVLVFVLLVAVVVLAALLWNDHKSTARIEHYITKPDGLNAWMSTEPNRIKGRLDTLWSEANTLCNWAAKSAPAEMKCMPGPGGTNDPPKPGTNWP